MAPDKKQKRTLVGIVVSAKMKKTVVVQVHRLKAHPKYERRYRVSKKYKAHDEKGEYQAGDKVLIEETRPLSRDKRWMVVKKVGEESRVRPTEADESAAVESEENAPAENAS